MHQQIKNKTTSSRVFQSPKVKLIDEPTPIHTLSRLGKKLGFKELLVKREDQTASIYGGNKIRNLEYIFADALTKGKTTLVTAAPKGSHFISALASHAGKFGLNVRVHEYIPHLSNHAQRQSTFVEQWKPEIIPYHTPESLWYLLTVKAFYSAARECHSDSTENRYWIAPGGSSALGAFGHFMALKEFVQQCQKEQTPIPDILFVGAGSCGTMAGLLAAKKMLGIDIQILGVRCVDWIVCNQINICRLANQLLVRLESDKKLKLRDVTLISPEGKPTRYGYADRNLLEFKPWAEDQTQLSLDTTYSVKVMKAMVDAGNSGNWEGKRIVYWHTYSPAADQ